MKYLVNFHYILVCVSVRVCPLTVALLIDIGIKIFLQAYKIFYFTLNAFYW